MAALLNTIVCYFVAPAHNCCALRVVKLLVVYGRLALCCSAAHACSFAPCSVKKQQKNGGFHSIWRCYLPGDRGRIEFPLKKNITSSPNNFGYLPLPGNTHP